MNPIIVIHHSADFDGLFCREIARKFFGDRAQYIGWDYGQPVPVMPNGAELYMLDISVDGLMDWPGLTWIDHHKSAIEKYPATIPGYRIDGVAACRLAWQWFFGDYAERLNHPTKQEYIDRKVTEPLAVRLAGEYDIWDKRDERTDVFQAGLRSMDLTGRWNDLLSMKQPTISEVEALHDVGHQGMIEPDGRMPPPIVWTLLENGRVLQYSTTQANASLAREVAFDLEFEGLKFLALNKPRANSMTFLAGLRPEHDACLSFYWLRDKWRISLYGAPLKPALDLSPIAVKYGGGGHRQACGFEAKTLPFAL